MSLNVISKHCVFILVGPISPPQPPSVSAWNKPLTSFAGTVTPEVSVMSFCITHCLQYCRFHCFNRCLQDIQAFILMHQCQQR